MRGTDATAGFIAYLDNGPSQENSCLVDVLLSLGAVPFCKTNVPQTLMVSSVPETYKDLLSQRFLWLMGELQTVDSHNNIFGRTLNPWNTTLTAGGSTGGECALIAFRGSPLGIGTDVAGRFPLHGRWLDVLPMMVSYSHVQALFVYLPYAVEYMGSSQLRDECHTENKRLSATQDFATSYRAPVLLPMIWTVWRFS